MRTFDLPKAIHNSFFYCYSFLFISKKPAYKEICHLSTFRGACFLNISVMEAYILKRDIWVSALFALFYSNND